MLATPCDSQSRTRFRRIWHDLGKMRCPTLVRGPLPRRFEGLDSRLMSCRIGKSFVYNFCFFFVFVLLLNFFFLFKLFLNLSKLYIIVKRRLLLSYCPNRKKKSEKTKTEKKNRKKDRKNKSKKRLKNKNEKENSGIQLGNLSHNSSPETFPNFVLHFILTSPVLEFFPTLFLIFFLEFVPDFCSRVPVQQISFFSLKSLLHSGNSPAPSQQVHSPIPGSDRRPVLLHSQFP